MAQLYIVFDTEKQRQVLTRDTLGSLDNHFDVGASGQAQFVCTQGTVGVSTKIDVFRNGVLMREGASHDWQRNTDENAIDFNYTVPENSWVLVRIYGA